MNLFYNFELISVVGSSNLTFYLSHVTRWEQKHLNNGHETAQLSTIYLLNPFVWIYKLLHAFVHTIFTSVSIPFMFY